MAKLSQILQSKQGVNLEFVDLIQDETRDGLPIVRLVLKNPIGSVFGRQITDTVTEDRVRLQVNDVEMVSIGKEALDEIDAMEEAGKPVFTWIEEGKSGTINCDLSLDVSNALEVWVVKTKFGAFAASRRNERNQKRNSGLVARLREQTTRKEFAGTDTSGAGAKKEPEPVTGP